LKDRAEAQATLFELPPPVIALAPAVTRAPGGAARVAPVVPPAPERSVAERMPAGIRLGGMSWSYPGWAGSVYQPGFAARDLSRQGLPAYAAHPLLRAVEIDRSYYDPLSADAFGAYAAQVPDDFRFMVKAHEDCTVDRFPPHARYGPRKGLTNPRFLDPDYAATQVVPQIVAGLGAKLGVILWQFPPQDAGGAAVFAARLRDFLRRLPAGPTYAVELRNEELLGPAYGAALADTGAVHCHNVWTAMPSLLRQARQLPPATRRPLVIRWLLRRGDPYEKAKARFEPFDRIVEEDLANRADVAALARRAHHHGVETIATIDNKAEGCAPQSIFRLARAIVDGEGPPDEGSAQRS
jgi:uncharacterized protein YecE (DUF72 family)